MAESKGICSEKVFELYHQRMTLQQIGVALGISPTAALYHLKKLDVPSRAGVEMFSAARRTYAINENFFSRWSPEMAWVLGLLCTDGNLSTHGRRVTFTSIDIDVLEKVKAVMGFEGPISRVNKQSQAHRIMICRARIYDDLLALGLTPAKSLTLKWPKVPSQFMRHFLRGVYEGDGSYCLAGRERSSLKISLVSGSDMFIRGVQDELSKLQAFANRGMALRCYKVDTGVKNPLYRLEFAAYAAVEEFYWKLYESVPESMSMSRKRAIIEAFLDMKAPSRMYVEELALAA